MEIIWFLHNYPPVCLGGAEFAAHRINVWLLKHGYKVKVYILDGFSDPKAYPPEFEGVQITYMPPHQIYSFKPPKDAIIASQLWATRQARQVYEMNNTKYIEFVHYVDHTVISPYPWTSRRDFTMVYNSTDTKERSLKLAPWLDAVPSHLMYPPMGDVLPVVPRTEPYVYPWITLVNFNRDKGADIFNSIATADSSKTRQYIAIKGGHGEQCTPVNDVTLLDPTHDMDSIYAKTRILVVPSKYETWSLVASEANARGIPVVTIDSMPALRENCGDAALYIPAAVQSDPKQWIQAFQTIESRYAEFSSATIKRRYDIEPILETLFLAPPGSATITTTA